LGLGIATWKMFIGLDFRWRDRFLGLNSVAIRYVWGSRLARQILGLFIGRILRNFTVPFL